MKKYKRRTKQKVLPGTKIKNKKRPIATPEEILKQLNIFIPPDMDRDSQEYAHLKQLRDEQITKIINQRVWHMIDDILRNETQVIKALARYEKTAIPIPLDLALAFHSEVRNRTKDGIEKGNNFLLFLMKKFIEQEPHIMILFKNYANDELAINRYEKDENAGSLRIKGAYVKMDAQDIKELYDFID